MSRSATRTFFVCVSLLCIWSTVLPAQQRTKPDTNVVILDDDDLFDTGFDVDIKLDLGKPYMTVWGGQSMIARDGMQADIENTISVGVTLGTEHIRGTKQSSSVRQIHRNGVYIWHGLAPDSAGTTNATLGLWRFGFEDSKSYGYAFGEGDAGVYFTHGSNGGWSVLNVTRTSALPDGQYLNDFGAALRYGESMRAGIDIRPIDNLSLNLGYAWDQVYPRHMFWEWAGSQIIEGAAAGIADVFIKAVGKSSPNAVPVMHFLLRNGIAAGFKALRSKDMNWPFGAVTPLDVHTFSIGATFTF